MTVYDKAYELVQQLVTKFTANYQHYMSSGYSEAEARQDFIDNFFIALGWDVNHQTQTNPYEQEVKIERSQKQQNESARKRADYAFFLTPNHKDEVFFVEAKKPSVLIENQPQHYFQTQRYGWNAGCPISALTDFEEFVIIDCRAKPDIKYALNGKHKSYRYTDYANKEKFGEIYWVFSREAVAAGSIKKFADSLPKAKGKVIQKALFKGGYQAIDDSFLEYIDGIRLSLAQAFKKNDDTLEGEQLTEAVQRTVDRLVFIRFLEDKFIEAESHVNEWKGWNDFIADCRKLDAKYNGVVFKKHFIDEQNFIGAEQDLFKEICQDISSLNSPYDFNYIPIHILGSIYERFLGKVIRTTAKRVFVEEKPEVRKAGGVYYTPKYIVDYIVQNTVGKQIAGKTPKQIAELHFADIACGSGSFLIGVYDCLLDYHRKYYLAKYADKTYKVSENLIGLDKRNEDFGNIEYTNNQWALTLKLKQDILLNNIYGVDIDFQAVEVTQLSLFLKMLEDESLSSIGTRQGRMFAKVLPDLTKNIVCGNSLIGFDIMSMNGQTSLSFGEGLEGEVLKKLNPMDYTAAFPKIMRGGGFDGIVGNPPYLKLTVSNQDKYVLDYYNSKYKSIGGGSSKNLFQLFMEKVIQLSSKCYSFIIPEALLTSSSNGLIRKMTCEKYSIDSIVVFDHFVFQEATIGTTIIVSKEKIKTNTTEVKKLSPNNEIVIEKSIELSENLNEWDTSSGNDNSEIINKIKNNRIPLKELVEMSKGMVVKDRSEVLINSMQNGYHPFLLGNSMGRYIYAAKQYAKYSDLEIIGGTRSIEKHFSLPRLLIRRTGSRLCVAYSENKELVESTIYMLRSTQIDLKYLLGLLNSKLLSFYLKEKLVTNKQGFPQILMWQLDLLPIVVLDLKKKEQKSQHDSIVNCVTQLLAAKQKLAQAKEGRDKDFITNQCNALDTQIDNLVYSLYDLTEEEIRIVEGE